MPLGGRGIVGGHFSQNARQISTQENTQAGLCRRQCTGGQVGV